MKITARKVFVELIDKVYMVRFTRGGKRHRADDKPGEFILGLSDEKRQALTGLTPEMTQDRMLSGGK